MILSTQDNKGNTPLMQSIIHQNKCSFDVIIQTIRKAKKSERITEFLNAKNIYGHTALHVSLMFRNINMLQELLDIGCNPLATDSELKNVYHYIAENNLFGFTRAIHESLLSAKRNTGRCESNTVSEIEMKLLSSKDSEGFTPIHLCIYRLQDIRIISELMGEVRELRGKEECLLIQTGKCLSTALHLATDTGDAQLIEYILQIVPHLKKSEFINRENGLGNTALHIGVASDYLESVKTLLKYGASLEVSNAEGERPIDYCDSEEMRHLLLTHIHNLSTFE